MPRITEQPVNGLDWSLTMINESIMDLVDAVKELTAVMSDNKREYNCRVKQED